MTLSKEGHPAITSPLILDARILYCQQSDNRQAVIVALYFCAILTSDENARGQEPHESTMILTS
jgi:hypothetical protein